MSENFNTPILLLGFNRPDTLEKIFLSIREVKPQKLYFAVDGPRENVKNENNLVLEVQNFVNKVDWECTISTLFNEKNLGCKISVSNAISWFFKNEEFGIILEDDCLPSKDFFSFCNYILNNYKNDDRIMAVTGVNFQNGKIRGNYSYYFSIYAQVWGWATWRRSWEKYDVKMKSWNTWKLQNNWKQFFNKDYKRKYFENKFNQVFKNEIDTWDYQWQFCIWKNNGLVVTPNKNLIQNIGFNKNATHTTKENHKLANMKIDEMSNLVDPVEINVNIEADNYLFNYVYNGKYQRFPLNLYVRFKNFIKKYFVYDK